MMPDMALRTLLRRLPDPVKIFIRETLNFGSPVRKARAPLRRARWNREGFAVLGSFFERDEIQTARGVLDQVWAERHDDDRGLVIDVLSGDSAPRRIRLGEASDDARRQIYKLSDVYLVDERVRSLVLEPRLVKRLKELVGEEVVAINSLHFERGSTQDFHMDTFYMEAPPGGQLIVSSICLEDAHPDAGPLKYFPKSHLIAPFINIDGDRRARSYQEVDDATAYYHSEVLSRGLKEARFCGKAGDTFLWHEQLFHGGSPINDMNRTRRSIVTHYWTKSSMVGWDIEPSYGGYYLRRPHQTVTNYDIAEN